MARCSNRSPQGSRPLPDSRCETGRRPASERPAPVGCPFLLAGGKGPVSWDRRPDGRAHPQHAGRRVSRDWSRALELLLVDPDRGMNLRNDVCHGMVDTLPKHRVALILQAVVPAQLCPRASIPRPVHPLKVQQANRAGEAGGPPSPGSRTTPNC
ncbi:DUF4209 domain-containing protein [Streptomyces sp. NPDC087859]|uniref:DUF4209 domain-containing protein n=1 Tax=Streptomyces sp. NPDC087859 TaxID=3365812 RepID=UPI0037F738A4